MTSNIIQTIEIERVQQVSERCFNKPEDRHSPKTLLSIRSTSVFYTQQSEKGSRCFEKFLKITKNFCPLKKTLTTYQPKHLFLTDTSSIIYISYKVKIFLKNF